MSVDQAREDWQAAGDYDSACRLIRAQAERIDQLERDLVAERENNVGEFESRSEAQRKARALNAQVMGLERDLSDFKASQHYRYIGVDGKPVLARELEDRAIRAENELDAVKQAVKHANDHADAAIASLAAERKRAQSMHRRAQKAEGKCLRLEWWHRVISGIAKHRKDWRLDQYARAGLRGSSLHTVIALEAGFEYWKRETQAELAAEKALSDQAANLIKGEAVGLEWKRECASFLVAHRKARGL